MFSKTTVNIERFNIHTYKHTKLLFNCSIRKSRYTKGHKFGRQKKYVNPDLLDKTRANHTYKDTRRNAQSVQKSTFWRSPRVEKHGKCRWNMEKHRKALKNELLHWKVVLDVCGKYRANRGLTYKNLSDASIWEPPNFLCMFQKPSVNIVQKRFWAQR